MYAVIVLILCFSGVGFAYYMHICCTMNSSTLHWHLAQWLPILFGAICYLCIGYETGKNKYLHSSFWIFGRVAASIAAAGVGYVVGRELFF